MSDYANSVLSEEQFVEMSVPLTGFHPEDLYATGMVEKYRDTLVERIGPGRAIDLYTHYESVGKETTALGREFYIPDPPPWPQDVLLADAARAVVKMWYVGAWYGLTSSAGEAKLREEQNAYADVVPALPNVAFMVSPDAYVNGLVWKLSGGHPPGAKPTGYGSWSAEPAPIPATPTGPYEEAGQ
ncbi:hypothetical protein [Streptomyces sp. CT34]|uniref:hypothetical protein n=1 Tax=Streptomyces sp. CT34 TaxID=1553907 RepID=UPI0005BE5F7A|nr:hypothetical protein [Streptomyces sp. CT34]